MSSTYLFGSNSIFAKIDSVTSFGMDTKLDKLLGFERKDVEGPKIGDLTVQTSSYGVEIGRVHGTIGFSGNLIWLENNLLKETAHKKKKGGKGGGATSAEPNVTYTYSATFAIGICEGPIDGIARIWCGDVLIYNAASSDVGTIIASNKSAKGMRIHLGSDDQLPDSRIEAARGVGNTPAFRGLAYVVFDDFQLADYGNTLQAANFKFEVVQVSDYNSYREVVSKVSGVTFSRVNEPGAGRPYIDKVDGIINVSTPTSGNYAFLTNGDYVGPTGSARVLPNPLYDQFWYSGYIGSDLLRLNYNFSPTIALDNQQAIYPTEFQDALPADHWLVGMTVSSDNLNAIFFTSSVGYVGGALPPADTFWITDASANVIKTGPVSQPFTAYDLGFGVTGQFEYDAISLENGCEFLWGVSGQKKNISLYRITDSFDFVVEIAGSMEGSFEHPAVFAQDGMAYVVGHKMINVFSRLDQVLDAPPLLSTVVSDELLASDLIQASDIEADSLLSTVRGYAVQGGSIRSAIEPLQTAYRFDVIQSGYKAKFIPRGGSPVVTIPWEDLILDGSGDSSEAITEEREMDTQLPVKTTVKYLDAVREYSVSNQTFERLSTRAMGKEDVEVPLVMTATEALQTAEILTLLPWLERSSFSFKLPPTYQRLEPCDVVTIQAPWASLELRIGKIDYGTDGVLDCSAVPNRSSVYSSQAVAVEPPPPISTIAVPGPTMAILMDIPLISENLQNSPSFIAGLLGYTPAWTGARLLQSADEGQTWSSLQGFDGMSTAGICSDTLPESKSTLIDQRSLTVQLLAGELESISRDQMLSGQHYVAYGADGRWEIVRFQNADLQEDGRYRVSGFVRGEKGTEWATGLHQVGDYFVLLDDPDNLSIGMTTESILSPRRYRAVTLGADIDSASDIDFTYKAVNLEPLSPVYPKAVRAADGGLTLSVQRRSRLSSSWWANGMEAPVGETTLSLEADVMSGTTVKRTLFSSSGSFAYTAADQITDFGSVQAPITFRVYQLSTAVGRGYPLEVSL